MAPRTPKDGTPKEPPTGDFGDEQTVGAGDVGKLSDTMGGSQPTGKDVSPWMVFPDDLPAVMRDFLTNTRPQEEDRDPAVIQMEIFQRILNAKTIDEVFQTGLVKSEEVVNTPMTVWSIRWGRSDFMDGPGVFCIIDVWDHVFSTKKTVSCGGINVVAQLYQLHMLNALPMVVELTESPRPTKSGYKVLWLRPRPDVPPVFPPDDDVIDVETS